jgi:ATP/maltotriose-dependent transcriptional regulator MalT
MAGTQHGNCMKGPEVTGPVRPRLIPDIDGTSNARLGLVIAPPGAGKTTLLTQGAAQRSTTVRWYRSSPAYAGAGLEPAG